VTGKIRTVPLPKEKIMSATKENRSRETSELTLGREGSEESGGRAGNGWLGRGLNAEGRFSSLLTD